MQNSGPHSLNRAFVKSEAQKPTEMEKYIDSIRSNAEQKIKYFLAAVEICTELGYDGKNISPRDINEAIERVSTNNGYAHGDSYKPFDPDMAFPDKDGMKMYFEKNLPQLGYKKLPVPVEPEFEL